MFTKLSGNLPIDNLIWLKKSNKQTNKQTNGESTISQSIQVRSSQNFLKKELNVGIPRWFKEPNKQNKQKQKKQTK